MRKKRILFCSEATFLNTGYATYTREVMEQLHKTGKYELAELASFAERNDPRGMALPWRYYGVEPNVKCSPKASKEEIKQFESGNYNKFGEFIFEEVCLDFKPDIVFDIRDFWMLEFVERSPYRNYFNWVIMPTVDAEPQARQWISTYSTADAVFSYSEWSGELMEKQSGGKIKYQGTAPPSANPAYKPMDKAYCRGVLGIDKDVKIIGTVMRNQRRKLYPDLFKAFRLFLDSVDNPSEYKLYCHTAYPDLGWEIPELLQQYSLSSSVYFTYMCPKTEKTFASLYSGARTVSPFTKKFDATMCNVRKGASYEQLSQIMNCFDLYVQYANSEGFGLPQVEAAACGIPVMATDYSAMSSVVKNLNGIPLTPKGVYKELETGCHRAIPDNENAAREFKRFFESESLMECMAEDSLAGFKKYYQWEQTAERLMDCFDKLPIIPEEKSWKSPFRIKKPASILKEIPPQATYTDLARWLIVKVLGEPDKLNTQFESRLVRDLMYESRNQTTSKSYTNESSAAFDGRVIRTPFSFKDAYNEMKYLAQKRNHWEDKRRKAKL